MGIQLPPVIDAHGHCGIKWHRHAGEPVYAYDAPRCRPALAEAKTEGSRWIPTGGMNVAF